MWDRDLIVEVSVWVTGILLFAFFVPRAKYREALISILVMQMPTWVLGLIAVQLGMVQYPRRFLADATGASFTYEFLALPIVSAIYNLHYPVHRRRSFRLAYLLAFPAVLTVVEAVIKNYTDLVRYIHWNWACTWLSVMLTLHGVYWLYSWFVRGSKRFNWV
jgi:hypothetical protein